ncbi:chorismate mutase [Aquabacterium humicola]|uniref:chorismate mutase n=1 Tax=Aquabacterium humicola TaxID=3237377 RepID=UPI002542C5F4|nr:chorismate mutase [Rubrivivax pictus]
MTDKTLQALRAEIDQLDDELVRLLARRFAVTREVGRLKARAALPAVDADREAAQQQRHRQLAAASGLAPQLVAAVFRLVIEEVVREHRSV